MHTKGITHVLQLQACTRAVYSAAKSGSPCVLESWCALDTATTHSTLAHTCAHGMHGGKLAHRKTSRRHRSTHTTWLHADTNKHAGAHQRRGCSLAAVCMGTVHAHCTGPRPKTEYQRPGRDHVFADWFGCVCACFYSTTTCPVSLSQLLTSLLAVLGSSGPEAGDISWASLLNVSTSVGPEILLDLALPTEAYQSVPRPQDASPRGLVAA